MKKKYISIIILFAFMQCSQVAKSQDSYIGELRLFPYNFAPYGWMECSGQLLPISQYTALFSLIGTYYGGNGTSNFALPNLAGRTAIQFDNATILMGQTGGTETETMTLAQLPIHTHTYSNATVECSSSNASTTIPGFYAVNTARGNEFNSTSNANSKQMNVIVNPAGGSQPRNNMQPFNTFTWCICISGIYPARQ